MPKDHVKDLLIRLRRARSAEKVQRYLKELPDHNVLNNDGDTLLHSYIRRKDRHKYDCLLALLVYGNVDVDKSNKRGFTPLHLAAELNDISSTEALLAFNCEVNSVNPNHCTPLDIALKSGSDVTKLLMSVGGQTGAVTARGLFVLKEQSVEVSSGVLEGNIVKEPYRVLEKLDEVDEELEDSGDSPDDGAHKQPSKVRFHTSDRYVIPDYSVTMPPPPALREEELLHYQSSHDTSHDVPCDEPDAAIEKSHDLEATPPDKLLGPPVEYDGGSSGDEGSEGLDDFSLSPTPLEQQSLDTLEKIERGSHTAEAYMNWQEHRSRRQRMRCSGSIRNRLRARDSLRRISFSGEESPKEAGPLLDASRVKPGDHVLCLDGGGLRGLIQVEIMRHIEEVTHQRIVDLFDWIVGTSTGGILALGLVYAKMTCVQLRQLYFEIKDKVFKNPTLGLACNTHELERILKGGFGEHLRMSHCTKPRVLVCAVNKATTALELTFFNNCFNDDFSDELVWKVARYASAAPIYFPECDNYVDGGLLANNPCNDALTKIQTHQKANGGSLSLVVSIGSGIYPPEPIGNIDIFVGKTWYHTPSKLKNIHILFLTCLTGGSERVSEDCRSRCEQQDPPIEYFRFNPQLSEAIEFIETNEKKLWGLIIKAKQLLENKHLQLDLLIQHLYYKAVQRMR